KAANRRELERLARVRPVAAAAAAFGRTVVEQEAVTEPVLRPPDDEIQRVLAYRFDRVSRSPSNREIFGPERRDVLAEGRGNRTIRPFADRTNLSVHFTRRCERIAS